MNKKTILALLMLGLVFLPQLASAIEPNGVSGTDNTTITAVVGSIATFIVAIIAILGIIFLIWGGILYVTSAGDETQIEKAKTTITYAILGLFIAGFAYSIEVIVLNQFSTM